MDTRKWPPNMLSVVLHGYSSFEGRLSVNWSGTFGTGLPALSTTLPVICITVTTTTAPPPTQIPTKINMPSFIDQYPYWMLYIHSQLIIGCSGPPCTGYEGNDLSFCKFIPGECNDKNFGMQITGSVVDSAGNPVPNVPLQFTDSRPSNDEYPWSTTDIMFG